jgi:hypothetical protein
LLRESRNLCEDNDSGGGGFNDDDR